MRAESSGTIGSQLALLRERVAREGHELVARFTDAGFSGAHEKDGDRSTRFCKDGNGSFESWSRHPRSCASSLTSSIRVAPFQ